jgi:DNA-binding NtrC family response regulator
VTQRLPNALSGDSGTSATTIEIATGTSTTAWVVDVDDGTDTRSVPLSGEMLVVGTSPSADLILRDETVSARHCGLRVAGGEVIIADLDSRNGTYVGGARVREARGQGGTVVTVGRSTLVIAPIHADTERPPGEPLPGVVGASIPMRRLADQVRRLARHALPVLIAGESGSGKELIARALHAEGPRRARPFVAINVTAVPRELVESELFGHERGAFTGAHARREGAFADAEGGTLFLDEIGDLPFEAQPKILRALDGYEVRRVGGAGSGRRADVRVVAATHARLEQRVARGEFRRDLYHRLECFVLYVPPLRERRSDLAAIARDLLRQLTPHVGPRTLTAGAVARLIGHNWPGNVRELRNVLCRAADGSAHPTRIDADDVDRALRRDRYDLAKCMTPQRARELFRDSAGNLSAAARAAGLPRTSFRKLLGA